MKNHILNAAGQSHPRAIITKKENAPKNLLLCQLGSGIGLLGGTGFLVGAVFLTIFEYFYGENLHGNWFYLAVLPLWVLGAHCLDKIEDAEKAERIERCKRTGMRDKDGAD